MLRSISVYACVLHSGDANAKRKHSRLQPMNHLRSATMNYRIAGSLILAVVLSFVGLSRSQETTVGPSAKEVRAVLTKAVDFLKTRQNEDGSFSPKIAGPGISALVAAGLLQNGHSPKEPMLAKTFAYLEKQVQKD